MCGRNKLERDVSEISFAFRIPPEYPTLNCAPSWNVAQTDNLPIVRYDPKMGSRTLDLIRWGLVPYWAKDIKIGFSTINAMAEPIDTKPVFREAFARRRCIVPVDSFYEWKNLGPWRGRCHPPLASGDANRCHSPSSGRNQWVR